MEVLAYVEGLNAPTALDDDAVTFESLIEYLRNHYGKKTTVLTGRTEFEAIRQESQTVEEFAAELQTTATYCKFQGADLDIRLRDPFVAGLWADAIRIRRMERDDISFSDALKLAADLERIARKSKLVGRGESSVLQIQSSFENGRASRPQYIRPPSNNTVRRVLEC